jgi:23S rRNA (uridine2552-2'-O)-methyltransferase
VLSPGGAFIAKVFQGGTERQLLDRLKKDFSSVKHAKPPASRADSAETYVVAVGFRGGSAVAGRDAGAGDAEE